MLNVILETCAGTLTQGLIYAILSYGIFITYKILDFPDLTVDGSFPLGAAVTAVLLTHGVNAWLTLPIALVIGALAGLCTGLIHVRAKVRDLLAGIITMTALYSINLQIAGSNLMVERARNMNLYVEFSSLDDVGAIIGRIKSQGAQIYEVDIERGTEESHLRPSAVFTIRLDHAVHHAQVMAAISELENVTTIDEI